ncbi:MAG TPA: hypothetical protein VHF22_08465, partial [Planctomycetota bacterium]|nr:hypothetical protein [Planctomycetota bacterium]
MGARAWIGWVLVLALAGCGGAGGSGSGASTSGASAAGGATGGSTGTSAGGSTGTSSGAAVVAGDEAVYPLVLVHGISGDPSDWTRMMDGLEPGRAVVRAAYADELAALAPGSIPRASVFAIEYYRRRSTDPRYFAQDCSIGGCPVARSDGI